MIALIFSIACHEIFSIFSSECLDIFHWMPRDIFDVFSGRFAFLHEKSASLIKPAHFFNALFWINFHWGVQNGWKSWKTMLYVFCLFTPLYRRFRLSRVSQRIDLDEIYRLASKIVNFTPCGSVFDGFCVEALKIAKKSKENLMKIWWKSYGNLLKTYENLRNLKKCKKSYENLLKIYGNLRTLTKCKKIYENLLKICGNLRNLTKYKKICENL